MTNGNRFTLRFGLKALLDSLEEILMIAFERTQVIIARRNNLPTRFFEC